MNSDRNPSVTINLSKFARTLSVETAFDVLAVAKRLKAQGKDVVELQIGDSPFPSTTHAKAAGIEAIRADQSHYCQSVGLLSFREAVARNYAKEFGVNVTAANVVVAPGAKVLEQFFCEAVLDPGDDVLVFSPQFPTYVPNIARRGANPWFVPLKPGNHFRPDVNEVERFLREAKHPRAIFLNSPHNPTGGVATKEDLEGIAKLILGKDVALFSDEPYCHMVWRGQHRTPLAIPGMLDQTIAAYTFSKSYSMSGWRLGYAVTGTSLADTLGKMINTSLSCVPPLIQLAGQAALEHDAAERDEVMQRFRRKVDLLVDALRTVPGVKIQPPPATFYVFPDVSAICKQLGIQSHGLAMYLLEGADDRFGVACLGGECFGSAGQGFLRYSCAEPDERLVQAMRFFGDAITRKERVQKYLAANPKYQVG
jgi:aspartate aminotransferase